MRPWLTAFGAACTLACIASAQQPSPLGGGTVVSSGGTVTPAAPRLPSAAPAAGMKVDNPFMKPYDPNRPLDALKGTNLNARDVVAPVSGLSGTQQPDLLDRLADKLSSVTRIFKPSQPSVSATNVTPGIFRRNRERHKMEWRRD
jgi:hypothetical protein